MNVINYVAKIIVYINSVVVCLFIDVVVQVFTQGVWLTSGNLLITVSWYGLYSQGV